MRGEAALALLLVFVRLSRPCVLENTVMICTDIPSHFDPGGLTMVMILSNVGEINSTVLHSDNLASIEKLTINNAGITGITEAAFSSFLNLSTLHLNRNMLSEMNPDWFGEPAVLRELSLSGNVIEVVKESMLNGLVGLRTLRLNKNKIRDVDPNSFRSQTGLAELDLSENRLTQVSPQVFTSLSSTRIRLDGNPWDCSCSAGDSVDFLKDLHSRSLLDREMDVTCETPPSLRGEPVWNVSVCTVTPSGPASARATEFLPSPPPWPTSETSIQPRPPDPTTTTSPHTALSSSQTSSHTKPSPATVSASTANVGTSPLSHPASQTETSVPTKPTDLLPTVTAPVSGSYATSPPSGVHSSSVPSKTSNPPMTSTKPPPSSGAATSSRPRPDSNTVCTLVAVIAVLGALLFVVCFLVLLRRRERNNKTVMPGRPTEEEKKVEEDSGPSENRDLEKAGRITGVRAKSANAIILTSPFCASLQTETEATAEAAGVQTGGLTNTTDVTEENVVGSSLDENPQGVSADVLPYLSIGTNQNRASPRQEPPHAQRLQMGKVIGRISTWPPTAAQWQERCKMKEEEEEGDGFADWKQNITKKFSFEVNKMENPSASDQSLETNDQSEANILTDSRIGLKVEELKVEELMIQDPATVRKTTDDGKDAKRGKVSKNQDKKLRREDAAAAAAAAAAAHSNVKSSSMRKEARPAETSRPRPENRTSRTSPDDETLLSGNEYAFMNLLHEVVQNNGRWTRERWKQIQVNKQRR